MKNHELNLKMKWPTKILFGNNHKACQKLLLAEKVACRADKFLISTVIITYNRVKYRGTTVPC